MHLAQVYVNVYVWRRLAQHWPTAIVIGINGGYLRNVGCVRHIAKAVHGRSGFQRHVDKEGRLTWVAASFRLRIVLRNCLKERCMISLFGRSMLYIG